MNNWNPRSDHVVSFIDLGTNSVRMLVVRLNPNYSYTLISQEKEVVRLGESEFGDSTLRREAMDRTVLVCQKFVQLSQAYGADEIIMIATSAAREATNQNVLVERMREEAGVELGVISGIEEARLIHLGVSSSVDLGTRDALFIDIGGGSTEVIIGDQERYSMLDSLMLGAIRTTTKFIPEGHKGPVDDSLYNKMKRHARGVMVHTVRSASMVKYDQVWGSSGTIVNLAEIAARAYDGRPGVLRFSHLKKLATMLRSLDLASRRLVPGINPDRADIIIAGAAILETFMEELHIEELNVCDRGVLNGMLVDYLSGIEGYPHAQRMSVRETSVLQLGRSCSVDEQHAETVMRLALELFDSAREIGLHTLGSKERELLRYAAYLHDVGDFISFDNHHLHSYYIVRNADLLGFEDREIAIIANLALYHRKRPPRRKDPGMADLDGRPQQNIITLSAFMRLAETLDRSHAGLVSEVGFRKMDKSEVVLEVVTAVDASMEVWGLDDDQKAFHRAFDRIIKVRVRGAA